MWKIKFHTISWHQSKVVLAFRARPRTNRPNIGFPFFCKISPTLIWIFIVSTTRIFIISTDWASEKCVLPRSGSALNLLGELLSSTYIPLIYYVLSALNLSFVREAFTHASSHIIIYYCILRSFTLRDNYGVRSSECPLLSNVESKEPSGVLLCI